MLDLRIVRVWRFAGEEHRIHYILNSAGTRHHCYVDRGNRLYDVLGAALATRDSLAEALGVDMADVVLVDSPEEGLAVYREHQAALRR